MYYKYKSFQKFKGVLFRIDPLYVMLHINLTFFVGGGGLKYDDRYATVAFAPDFLENIEYSSVLQ